MRFLAISCLLALPCFAQTKECANFYRIFDLEEVNKKSAAGCWGAGGSTLVLAVQPRRLAYGSINAAKDGIQAKVIVLVHNVSIAARLYGIGANTKAIFEMVLLAVAAPDTAQTRVIAGVVHTVGLETEDGKIYIRLQLGD